MSPRRLKHLSVCAFFSVLATLLVSALDSQRTEVHQATAGLRWARQVASQAEGMIFKARESGERDPVEWAVSYLSQGVEPRLVRVSRVRVAEPNESGDPQSTESYSYDRVTGLFDYVRDFGSAAGSGVRIQISLGYMGFLGSRSPLASDFLAFLCFSLCFALLFLRTGRYFGFDDTQRIRALVTQWVGGAKAQLKRHGVHVREMVRQAQRLAVSTGRSRELVSELRGRIHEGLSELHGSREFYQEGESIAARAETLALNMAIEANRLGGDARRIADMATELHRRIQALHAVNRKGQALVQRLERQIEPWSTDADLAHHAFDEVKEATDLLGRHIRETTETLLGQAKLIQGLNQKLGALDEPQVPGAAPAEASALPPTPEIHRLPDPLPSIPVRAKKVRPLFSRLGFRKSPFHRRKPARKSA